MAGSRALLRPHAHTAYHGMHGNRTLGLLGVEAGAALGRGRVSRDSKRVDRLASDGMVGYRETD